MKGKIVTKKIRLENMKLTKDTGWITGLFVVLTVSFIACNSSTMQILRSSDFITANSNPKAIAIANEVVEASGGAKAWNDTRFIGWNFFGSREHVWDKQTGDVHIKALKSPIEIKMNINTKEGDVWLDGTKATHPDSLSKYLDRGYGWWVNDSYWLVLPFKLQDSGVTLDYLGEAKTEEGQMADKLSLTFNNVGKTPQNKYHVYVDKATRHISQWDYYPTADDEEPRFKIPWKDYEAFGDIMLSGDRGQFKLTDIKVSNSEF